jgi:hypothetical protein
LQAWATVPSGSEHFVLIIHSQQFFNELPSVKRHRVGARGTVVTNSTCSQVVYSLGIASPKQSWDTQDVNVTLSELPIASW